MLQAALSSSAIIYPTPIPPSGVSEGHFEAASFKAAIVDDCNDEGGGIACACKFAHGSFGWMTSPTHHLLLSSLLDGST